MGIPSDPAPPPFPTAAPPGDGGRPPLPTPIQILFIDDDLELRALAFEALEREFPGVTCSGVSDAGGLARVLEAGGFDIVVADPILSWTESQGTIAAVQKRYPDIPMILFPVTAADRERLKAFRPGESHDPARGWPQFLFAAVRSGIEKAALVREWQCAVEALRAAESRFRSVFETATDAIVLADSSGSILGWNGAAQRIFGYEAAEVIGRPLSMLMPERYRATEQAGMRRYRETGVSSVVGHTIEAHGLRKDGTEFPLELSVGAWESEQGGGFSGVMRDITDRKRAQVEQQQAYEELRALSARVAKIQEEERQAIAREIHDELGQSLTALRLQMAWLRKRVVPDRAETAAKREKLDEMARLVDSLLHQVRRISAELRPGLLDHLGLAAAIESQAEQWSFRTGIPCVVRSSLRERALGPEVTVALFRIFQECLTNIARHARAGRVRVRLRERDGSLFLVVKDDGRGITEPEEGDSGSLGLLGMRERSQLIGGHVRITGRPGKGTTVTVSAPLARTATMSA